MLRIIIAALFVPTFSLAQEATLQVNDQTLTLQVPSGYSLIEDAEIPPYALVLETSEIEPWEEIAEFNEEILIIGYEFGSKDPDVIAERFTALFNSLYTYAEAERSGEAFVLNTDLVNPGLFDDITGYTSASRASSVTASANTETRKALVFETGFVMPGVTTYPIIEEVSFVLIDDFMIIARAQRVNVDDAATELQATGVALRQGIAAAQ